MSENQLATGSISTFEAAWDAPRASWTKAQWRTVAESMEKDIALLEAEAEQLSSTPKRGAGRPRNNVYKNDIGDRYFASIGGRPKKRRGRPRKYDDARLALIYETVESTRTRIEVETGKRPTIKAAIENFADEWGRACNQPKYWQHKEVARWQRRYSEAKAKSLEMRKK